MELCSHDPNAIIGTTNITWAQAESGLLTPRANASYLRPNDGGALLPWMYTVIVIIVHIPTVLIRVIKWERVQTWSLVLTFFTVVVYIQAFVSTKFEASKILVWTPIILIIDAGSMLQLFFLVIEAERERIGDRNVTTDPSPTGVAHPPISESTSLLAWYQTWRAQHNRCADWAISTENGHAHAELQRLDTGKSGLSMRREKPSGAYSITTESIATPIHPHWKKDQRFWVAILSLLFFIAVLALQIIGLIHAIDALDPHQLPEASWCSTLFQPFGIAIVDGNCDVRSVELNNNKGIGCVNLPGVWQQGWIKATIAVLAVELIFELADLLILYRVDVNHKWRGAKMKRPWLSIFSGMIVLLATLLWSISYATSLPPEITERVMVLADVRGPVSYNVHLHSAGLRGGLIGWNDGLFESWKGTYFGS